MLNDAIEKNRDELLKTLGGLIKIRSVREDDGEKPFGQGVKDALHYTLKKCEELGFTTCNMDDYVGYAEYGEGEEMVAVLGHLDVVPEGEGWATDPYLGEVVDGSMVGRGAIDDKGPVVACIYALKAIKDLHIPLKRRVRLIFGTCEETGSEDLKYYREKGGELPVCGFTPDAQYPVINGEKGIVNVTYTKKIIDPTVKEIKGGTALNVVPESARAVIHMEEGEKVIRSTGRSAHAAGPQNGENAIVKLIESLLEFNLSKEFMETLDFLDQKIGKEVNGESLGIGIEDQPSGKLTLNLGLIDYDGERLRVKINYRYPVTKSIEDVRPIIDGAFAEAGFVKEEEKHKKPLYIDPDSDFIKTLLAVYKEFTGIETEPISIGGGTYAKALPNVVAFGPLFDDDEVLEHLPNERWSVDRILLNAKIYAQAIYALAKGEE